MRSLALVVVLALVARGALAQPGGATPAPGSPPAAGSNAEPITPSAGSGSGSGSGDGSDAGSDATSEPPGPSDDAQRGDDGEPVDDGGEELHEDAEVGPVVLIEAVEITGNTATSTEIIRRALPIGAGDILHSSDVRLRNARFKVLALGFFRDVTLAMRKGSARGRVVIEVQVVERGTFVLNRLWFGSNTASPYWLGADVGDRNVLGHGVSLSGGGIFAHHGDIANSRDQWAAEIRIDDSAVRGTRWGANASLTAIHGSEPFRIGQVGDLSQPANFDEFHYRRIGGRAGATFDASAMSRFSGTVRIEKVDANVPVAPTETLADGTVVPVALHLDPGSSRVVTAGLGYDYDTRADPILPHSGSRVTISAEVGTGALGSSYDFATIFARFEQWWPLRDERHAIGIHAAGGAVIGDAPRFDRIHISDVDHMLTPRALGLVLSTASPFDVLGTRSDKPTYGTVGGSVSVEYAARLFRGSGKNRVYGGDLFLGLGLWGLADTDDVRFRDTGVWKALPIDAYGDAGIRIDTDIGVFELTLSNLLGRVR